MPYSYWILFHYGLTDIMDIMDLSPGLWPCCP